jgi:hypothetical protein
MHISIRALNLICSQCYVVHLLFDIFLFLLSSLAVTKLQSVSNDFCSSDSATDTLVIKLERFVDIKCGQLPNTTQDVSNQKV